MELPFTLSDTERIIAYTVCQLLVAGVIGCFLYLLETDRRQTYAALLGVSAIGLASGIPALSSGVINCFNDCGPLYELAGVLFWGLTPGAVVGALSRWATVIAWPYMTGADISLEKKAPAAKVAKKRPARKPAARKQPAKKPAAKKRSARKKPAAKKPAAKKRSARKKPAAKKRPARRA